MAKYKDRATLPEVLKVLLSASATFFLLLFVEKYMHKNGGQTMSAGMAKDAEPVKSVITPHDDLWGTRSKSSSPTASMRPRVPEYSRAPEPDAEVASGTATSFSSKVMPPHIADGIQKAKEESRLPHEIPSEPKSLPAASKLRPQGSQEATSVSSKPYLLEDTAGECPQQMYDTYRTAGKGSSNMIEWCRKTRSLYNVVLGRSWGSLPNGRFGKINF